jgi:uncharacterized membrane protein YczE
VVAARALTLTTAAVVVTTAVGCGTAPASRLHAGQRRVFSAGTLRIGTVVSCASHGVRVGVRVPPPGDGVTRVANGLHGPATVRVLARADGSVVAGCT